MKKTLTVLLLAMLLVGCSNEPKQVQAYLATTDQVMVDFQKLGQDYTQLGLEVQKKFTGTNLTAESVAQAARATKPRIKELEGRFQGLMDRVRKAGPPPAAQEYHRGLLVTFEAFEKALKAYSDLTTELEKGAGMDKLKLARLTQDMQKNLQDAMSSAAKAQEARKKLMDQFSLTAGSSGTVPEP